VPPEAAAGDEPVKALDQDVDLVLQIGRERRLAPAKEVVDPGAVSLVAADR